MKNILLILTFLITSITTAQSLDDLDDYDVDAFYKKEELEDDTLDEDGNEIPGIRTPDIAVPLATYTGWNFRPENWAAEAMDDLKGSFFPLDYSRTQGKLSKDPRTTWKERYISRARYVRMVVAAVEQLVEDRLLLDEDADRYVNEALIFDTIRGHDLNLEGFRRKHERWTHLGSPEAGFKPT